MGVLSVLLFSFPVSAALEEISVKYPYSLESRVQELLILQSHNPHAPALMLMLAELYLDMGDDLYTKVDRRLAAYQQGAEWAKRALLLREQQAEAHFLCAANLGNAAQLRGLFASALTVYEIKGHAARALELQPDHAPALHMMGMMLENLPWFFGGDSNKALDYLQRAVAADKSYIHARLNLAKLYIKRNQIDVAKRELLAIQESHQSSESFTWVQRYKPEVDRLLLQLEEKSS